MGGYNDLVAWADAQSTQRQRQRVQSTAHGHAVGGAAVLRELRLERLGLLTEQVPAATHHAKRGRIQSAGRVTCPPPGCAR